MRKIFHLVVTDDSSWSFSLFTASIAAYFVPQSAARLQYSVVFTKFPQEGVHFVCTTPQALSLNFVRHIGVLPMLCPSYERANAQLGMYSYRGLGSSPFCNDRLN